MPQILDRKLASEVEVNLVDILNKPKTRWAISDEFETWVPVELSKGYKLKSQYLFDRKRGNTQEMAASIFDTEVYYIISGHGVMYVADSEYVITPGSALYLEPNIVHGIDSLGKEPLHTMVIFGEQVLDEWTPVEQIYTEVRKSR